MCFSRVRLRSLLALASVVFGLAIAPQRMNAEQPAVKLSVIDTLRLGGARKWDYPILDTDSQRLYVACDNHVQVIDTGTGKRIGDIGDVQGAHGIAIVHDKTLGFITCGRENAIAVFDLDALKIKQKIKTQKAGARNPDAIIYDTASRKVFAFCAGGDTVVIDPSNLTSTPIAIHAGGKLEYGRADGAGKVYVNNEDKSEIDVIDSKTMKLVDRWPLAPLETPSGLAIDVDHHRLFAVGENKKMAIVDYKSGKLLATIPIGEGSDGCAFDAKLGVALSSNGGDGTLTVVGEKPSGEFAVLQTLDTAKSGRTIVDDPTNGRFYIPAMLPTQGRTAAQFGVLVIGSGK
jgi:hypothetical protein